MLSPGQIDELRERGLVVVPGAVPSAELAALRAAALAIVDDFDIDAHRTVFSTRHGDVGRDQYFLDSAEGVGCFLEEDALDGDGRLCRPKPLAINKIGHALHDRVPAFRAFCRLPLFGAALRAAGYRAPVLWQTMYIFKQPGIGGEVRWHQDASYLATDPPAVTGLWIAIEDARRDNGCLWVAPGGHRSPLREIYEVDWQVDRPHRCGVLRRLDDTPWPSLDRAEPIECEAGTLVVFHDHLPHFSAHNASPVSRHAFTMHVAERGAAWRPSNWLQRPTLGDFPL